MYPILLLTIYRSLSSGLNKGVMASTSAPRPRALSEDIPDVLRELLQEVPQSSQTLLYVDNMQQGTTANQLRAEEQFLDNKNIRNELTNCSNSYDYAYLRNLLKSSPTDALYIDRSAKDVKNRPVVEISHRSYENEFLREPKRNERKCAKGNCCEGLKITTTDEGFILREYLLPSQYKRFLEKAELPLSPQLCLMCRRAEVAKLYVCMRADNDTSSALISDFYNFGSVPGEYALDQMLLPSTSNHVGLFDPVVLHVRKNYTLTRIAGIRYYSQSGYREPKPTSMQQKAYFLN